MSALAFRYSSRTGAATRWSTGMSKNPWIWPEWKSTDSTRLAPSVWSMSATNLASIMMSCSITASFTGDEWVWTMKTCAPRIDSSNRQWISPLANSRTFASVSSTPSFDAMSWERAGWHRPVTMTRRRLARDSTAPAYRLRLGSVGPVVDRRDNHARGDPSSRSQDDERGHLGLGADRRVRRLDRGDLGVFSYEDITQVGVGTDLGSTLDDAAPAQHRPRQDRHLRGQFDVGVDVGVLGIPDRHPAQHPSLVDPLTQDVFGAGQLESVVDTGRFRRIVQEQ